MNAGLAHTLESMFGPASDLIDVSEFVVSSASASQIEQGDEVTAEIMDECSVAEICDSLSDIWNNPALSAHLLKDHDHIVSALHATVGPKTSKSARKVHLPDPDTLSAEVTIFQASLDAANLKSLRLDTESVLFLRTSRNSDSNILSEVKSTPGSVVVANGHDAILIISIHDRVPWGPSYVVRSSQHALLSSQSLQDLYDCMPCPSKNLPGGANTAEPGCAICLEGVAYGTKYADNLLKHLDLVSKKPAGPITTAPTSIEDTALSSLCIRIGEPYWLIHSGNCEHFVVFDQIRRLHPSDRLSGYPLTLQVPPTLLDLCRACNKVPAVWSIVGDLRLGESPCVLCGPCRRNMGECDDEGIIELPIP